MKSIYLLLMVLVPLAFIGLAAFMVYTGTKGFGWVILCAVLTGTFKLKLKD